MDFTTRPTLLGFGGAVSAGHYLATEAGLRMLGEGGNAADAACAMGLALQVLEPHMNGPAGEVPILVYEAASGRVYAISGQGTAPRAATIERMRALGLDLVPGDGLLAATVPAALDAWCLLLERFGTRRFADVAAPARALAERGFPMYPFLRNVLCFVEPRFREEWPGSAALYLPIRAIGQRQANPGYARLLAEWVEAERAQGGGREAGIRAARDSFYRGRAAEVIERFLATPVRDASGRAHSGLLAAADLAEYEGAVEDPVRARYRGAEVFKCPPWTQGPVFLQQLRLLEGFDLAAMGHNGVEALHTWIEAAKLAFADREACYGDPRFAAVPLEELLSDSYTRERRAQIDPERASHQLRPGRGRLPEGWRRLARDAPAPFEPQAAAAALGRGDTTQLDVADRHGNLVSATPSGAWIPSSPVIPERSTPTPSRPASGRAPRSRLRWPCFPTGAAWPSGRRAVTNKTSGRCSSS
jgi:gamma-glutamyltranspeptidase/glutathione hydrolase